VLTTPRRDLKPNPCTNQELNPMCIVASPDEPRHPAPRELRPIAGARRIGDGFFEIAIQPGAVAADVAAALDAIPFDAIFVEIYDGIDKILIFNHVPPSTGAPVSSRAPDAPAPASACPALAAVA
jgi:uncharacterized repeat protein (TIGR03917 family)